MLLERLSNACGIPGREDEVRALLKEELSPIADDIWSDAIGNLIVRKGDGPIRVMLDAHMDEVGFCITGFTEDGCLQFKSVGGHDPRVIPGRHVWVTNRRIPGVVGAKAIHLTGDDERGKPVPLSDMVIDLGCRTKDEAESICELGDPIYWATTFERFSDHVVKGKAFDDRAGCAVLAAVLQEADVTGLTVYGVFTAQEEVGLRGARIAAYNLNPHMAIALEGTGSANIPGVGPFDTATNMGEGPAISLVDNSSIAHPRVREELTRLAKEHGIAHQYRRLTAGGTDAGGIHTQRAGIPACTVSVPCRYIHSAAALLDLRDLRGATELVKLFLGSVQKGDFQL